MLPDGRVQGASGGCKKEDRGVSSEDAITGYALLNKSAECGLWGTEDDAEGCGFVSTENIHQVCPRCNEYEAVIDAMARPDASNLSCRPAQTTRRPLTTARCPPSR